MRFDIPESELNWRFVASGGPGGQHANRSNTKAEVTFDIAGSDVFDDVTRQRIIASLGTSVRVVEDRSRSQSMNRRTALRRLHAKLEEAARPPALPRKATKPSRAAKRRRMEAKRHRGQTKKQRQRPTPDD
ncbi:MAG: alternative ribosome rescue aminoacyl-tRNA hydrolase ArfB [Acidimicrobiia bacterium]